MTVTAPGEAFEIEQASNALQGRRWFKKRRRGQGDKTGPDKRFIGPTVGTHVGPHGAQKNL